MLVALLCPAALLNACCPVFLVSQDAPRLLNKIVNAATNDIAPVLLVSAICAHERLSVALFFEPEHR
jgi:hypothetical protein